ncbi:unnamed protein product [Eruca vesicaria subsp. sativa]|uniref:Uncharacterized protein n=1 Tax=Eruca vesicaria subsp. sativa TaxID=29727 RepID=A0ABC8LJ93_ERUVS|nr:unnamed protein product [Eruca vesicaria subsp. sativa]
MSENRSPDSCLSSQVFSKLTNGKRALEVFGDEIRPTKSLKLMGFCITYDSDSSDYSLSEEESDSSNNNNGVDSSDSHSLFNEIGRDSSIDCLLRCSRSAYGSIASLNRNFRSLVKSGDIYKLRKQNGFVEHWVYFSCQLLEWVAFDPVEKKWMKLPTMPSSVTFMSGMSPAAEAPPLVAVVDNQLYAADHADMEVRKYDKEKRKWLTIGTLPERAGSVNGWGLAFRACGERLIVIGGPKNSGGGFIELNSWVPSQGGPPEWTLLDRKHSSNFVYNCAVMGC